MNIKTFSPRLKLKYTMSLFVLVALFVLAGCGSGSSSPQTTGTTPTATSGRIVATPTTAQGASTPTLLTPNSCNLATTAQASAILGATAQAHSIGIIHSIIPVDFCQYTTTAGPPPGPAADLGVGVASDPTSAQTLFTEAQQQAKAQDPSTYQDVSGLGDAAFTATHALYVLKGKSILVILVFYVPSSNPLPDEKLFAQAALPNVS